MSLVRSNRQLSTVNKWQLMIENWLEKETPYLFKEAKSSNDNVLRWLRLFLKFRMLLKIFHFQYPASFSGKSTTVYSHTFKTPLLWKKTKKSHHIFCWNEWNVLSTGKCVPLVGLPWQSSDTHERISFFCFFCNIQSRRLDPNGQWRSVIHPLSIPI